MADLSGVRLKLDRAEQHLSEMQDEWTAFARESTNVGDLQTREEGDWVIVELPAIPQAPPSLALRAGDAIHNLRATLDYLVWQLVIREGRQPGDRHQFPIYESEDKFTDEVRAPKNRPERSPLYGVPVGGDAWTIIEDAQPFQRQSPRRPKDHPLAMLRRLSNMDKHHALLTWMAFHDANGSNAAIGFTPGVTPLEIRHAAVMPLSLEHPTELRRYRFPAGLHVSVELRGQFSITPCLGDPGFEDGRGAGATQIFTLWNTLLPEVRRVVDAVGKLPRVNG